MLVLTNDDNKNKDKISFYNNRYTINYISDRKYGDHTTIEKIDKVRLANNENRFISINELIEEDILENNPRDKKRILRLFDILDKVLKRMDIIYLRFDIYPDKTIEPMDRDYLNFLTLFNNEIESNEYLNKHVICSIGNIELSNSNKWHLHHGLMINIKDINIKNSLEFINRLYEEYKRILIKSNDRLFNCNINLVDMSKMDSNDKYYPITRTDIKAINNLRVLLCYHCKDSIGPKSNVDVFKRRYSNKLFNIYLNDDYFITIDHRCDNYKHFVDGLMGMDYIDFYRGFHGRHNVDRDKYRNMLEYEDKIIEKYGKYTVIGFTVCNSDSDATLMDLLDYLVLRYRNKLFKETVIGYSWNMYLDEYNIWNMNWMMFFNPLDRGYIDLLYKEIDRLVTIFNLENNLDLFVKTDTICNAFTINDKDDIVNRNFIRDSLVKMIILDRDTKGFLMNNHRVRIYGLSRI